MNIIVPDEKIAARIFFTRGIKIMLDRDLAELYQVETKLLKQLLETGKKQNGKSVL
jgi:hypothetical protein